MILEGDLISNEKLPSTRSLAIDLGVSRNTILEVYNQLIAEGYLEGCHGSGTKVATGIKQYRNTSDSNKRPTYLEYPLEDRNLIDFRSGIPDLSLFPRREWAKRYQCFCYDLPDTSFRYSSPYGVLELRNAIAEYLYNTRGISCSPSKIMIVSGATQGLSLISSLLYSHIKPNVIVEDPTHHGLLQVIAKVGYEITGVPVDEKGMDVSKLPDLEKVSFLYTTPSHQYPLGGILPIQRRQELIQYATKQDCYIVEDDYDSEFRYEGQPVNSLYELNPDKVIYIGSFSKILAPSIRLGYILLPDILIDQYKVLKMYSDVHTESLSQYILADFIKTGGLENHIRKMKKVYSQKRMHLLKELTWNFKGEFQVIGAAAGLHIIVQFKHITFTDELVEQLLQHHIKIYPVERFALKQKGKHSNEILLGYAHLSLQQITNGISILSNTLHSIVK